MVGLLHSSAQALGRSARGVHSGAQRPVVPDHRGLQQVAQVRTDFRCDWASGCRAHDPTLTLFLAGHDANMRYFKSIRLALAPVNAKNIFKPIPNQLVITVGFRGAASPTATGLDSPPILRKLNSTAAVWT